MGKPAIALPETKERPEGVALGDAESVGTSHQKIATAAQRQFTDSAQHEKMTGHTNPYGDDRAAERMVQGLLHHFSMASRPKPF